MSSAWHLIGLKCIRLHLTNHRQLSWVTRQIWILQLITCPPQNPQLSVIQSAWVERQLKHSEEVLLGQPICWVPWKTVAIFSSLLFSSVSVLCGNQHETYIWFWQVHISDRSRHPWGNLRFTVLLQATILGHYLPVLLSSFPLLHVRRDEVMGVDAILC